MRKKKLNQEKLIQNKFFNKLRVLIIALLLIVILAVNPYSFLGKRNKVYAASSWLQNDWSGGSGQINYSISNKFNTSYGLVPSSQLSLASTTWYNPSWAYRKSLTIDHTKINSTQVNFPLLINLPTDSNLSVNAQTSGKDILFTSSNGITKLDHELEKYNNLNGNLLAWARIPSVSSTIDTVIYMYYGNPSAISQQNKTGTWNSNFSGTWHMDETSGHMIDSTINSNNSISETSLVSQGTTVGKVGGAYTFNGSTINISDNANNSLDPSTTISLEGWINLSQLPSVSGKTATIFRKQFSSTPFNSYTLTVNTPANNIQLSWYNNSGVSFARASNTALVINTWYYVVGVVNGSTIKIYINGVDDSVGTAPSPTGTLEKSNDPLFIGTGGNATSSPLIGSLDELRISSTAINPDYINATYKNINSPSTFLSVGNQSLTWDISNWYNSSWQYRKKITIDYTKVTTTQTNFPFLLNLSLDNDLISKAQSTGNDLVFTASDGSTKLDHEIEKFNNATGSLVAWVRIPSLSSTLNTEIYMYYGNATASNQQNKNGVWDSNFGGIWHFSEGSGHHLDSTSNINNTTNETALVQQGTNIGKVDGADKFSASTLTVPNNVNNSLLPGMIMSVEGWVKIDQLPSALNSTETLIRKQVPGAPFNTYVLALNTPSNNVVFTWNNTTSGSYSQGSKTPLAVGAWYYVAATIDSSGLKVYVNGIDDSNLVSPIPTGTLAGGSDPLFFGSGGNATSSPLAGTLDEIRISKVVRSPDYFLTSYRNLNSPSTFSKIGGETSFSVGNGVLNSSIYSTNQQSDYGILNYSATIPAGTSVKVKVRSANNISMIDAADFDNCPNILSGTILSTTSCINPSQRYVQYQVVLQTTNSQSPTFQNITTNFTSSTSLNFVQKVDTDFYLNGQKFKYGGGNIYWLGLDETTVNIPTKFKIDDAINTASELGANTIRSFGALSVGCTNCIESSLGTFSSNGMDGIDYAIYKAGLKNIKVILPLIDNFHYYNGGKHTFTDWRALTNEDNFFTDPTVLNDFENFVSHILNHVNAYTGIAYKNDPTIMTWETGNELFTATPWVYYDWTETISKYIKSIAPNQIVQDGHTCSTNISFDKYSLGINTIDSFSCHYYPLNVSDMQTKMTSAINAGKVFDIGEYDWTGLSGGDSLSSFFSATESSSVAGDLFWNLEAHKDTEGYIFHNEKYSLYYPGTDANMTTRFQTIRTHNYAMKAIAVPSHLVPSAPYLHDIITTSSGYNIDWRGSAGANNYNVERSNDNISWTTIGTGISDSNTPWIDTTSDINVKYYYRVKAINLDSVSSPYSNVSITMGLENRNVSFDYLNTTDPLAFWNLTVKSGASANITSDTSAFFDGISSANINIAASNADPTYVQLNQANISLVSGKVHTITLAAKASSTRTITIAIQQNYSPFNTYYLKTFNIGTSWQVLTTNFTPNVNDNNAIYRISMGDTTGTVNIDRSMIYSTSLLVQVLDSSNNLIAYPTAQSDPTIYSFSCYTILSNLIDPANKIRVINNTPNSLWNLSFLAKNGNSTLITTGTQNISYNDTNSCSDPGAIGYNGGQMSINTSGISITPSGGCSANGITTSVNQSFIKNTNDKLSLVTSNKTTPNQCYWDIQGAKLSQIIPIGQSAGNYSIDLLFSAQPL